ncbi:tetratricopeptide repeat protein [Gilvimarinus sp. DA14]|uniref:tetratricopeptide repeat protein n=1 Tax=Gilvimarinus sp. DA14 TaxID=2956798 RepID=UPI0020B762CE|nr:tetratricopeptide repeat protein [Gilvimarinus sp. DA14]UTF61503.1 hypothetical protein NHM04_06820 [Gilvimarinus sp. DA14]
MLVACAGPQVEPSKSEVVQVQPREPELTPEQRRAQQIAELLYGADRALARDRLLSPAYDNAYDRYSSVLLLDPDNKAATLGLQSIVLRYLDMARSAAQRSRFSEAETYLDRAARVLPQDTAVQSLVAQQRDAIEKPAARPISNDSVALDRAALAQRSDAIKAKLAELALRAKTDDSMVLIVAGTDAQGRWIYQTMREAVAGYLLRGDIQIGSPARIEFLPPL